VTDYELRIALLTWVQKHTILRRRELGESGPLLDVIDGAVKWRGLVSDNEATEELLDCVRGLVRVRLFRDRA
jgi:hypothetical protein